MDWENLGQVIDALTQVSDLLYQENVGYAYKMLVLILEDLNQIISKTDEQDQQELKRNLNDALQAMENQDYVLLADILQYEIVECLQKYVNK